MSVDPLLGQAARLAVDWAKTLCGTEPDSPHACDWYHGAWPMLRLIGTVSGAKGDEAFFQAMFSKQARSVGCDRVLIAGAADYGILEQVLTAFRRDGVEPRVTVVDQCQTALKLNRWYADQMGADIETCQSDILCFSSDEPFDLVTTHSILSFIPQDQHLALFGNWRRLLRKGGRLIISQAVRPKYRGTAVRRFSAEEVEVFVQRALDDASRNGAALHFPESELAALAQRFARNKFAYVVSELTALEQGLQHGGFMIESLTDVNRALLGHKSASPDAETTMTNAYIVARAV